VDFGLLVPLHRTPARAVGDWLRVWVRRTSSGRRRANRSRRTCSAAELILTATWTASREELRERLQEPRRLGYSHVAVNFGLGAPGRLEDWAEAFSSI